MPKKSFFRERTVDEIKGFRVRRRYSHLIERIDELDSDTEALQIMKWINPGKFYQRGKTGAEASRLCFKHGNYLRLRHPKNQGECYESPDILLAILTRDFAEFIEGKREDEINYVGYSIKPSWGDKRTRMIPFSFIPEGLRLFAYAENNTSGIKIDIYPDVKRVKKEGATMVVEVPSREKKEGRYKYKLLHVPVIRGKENLATILQLKPALLIDEKIGEPIKGRPMHDIYNIRYTAESDPEASEVITFYPQDIAAYIKIAGDYWKNKNILTPIEMNPFALTSKHGAEFYNKLCNNVLIFDSSLERKDKLRKLHLSEKSILFARGIAKFGRSDFAYWEPERDGKLKDYNWTLEES